MDSIVQNIEAIPLTGDDLVTIANKMGNNKIKWMQYLDLQKFESIDQLFELDRTTNEHRFNSVFILIDVRDGQTIQPIGHWISLSIILNRVSGVMVSYYDPYGLTINEDLLISMQPDLFHKLLRREKLDVNKSRHQKFKALLNNCGRHVCVRSIFHFLNNKQYNELIMRPVMKHDVRDADVLVSLMTFSLAKSDEIIVNVLRGNVIQAQLSRPSKTQTSHMGGRIV